MPIVKSLFDTDFYKFTMGQVIFKRHANVPVRFSFKNRTKGVSLAEIIPEDELRAELDNVRSLRFYDTGLQYLRGMNEYGKRMFCEPYLEFLGQLKLPSYELKVGENYRLEFPGKWAEVTYWEIYALAIINELYYRNLTKSLSVFKQEEIFARGTVRLAEKIMLLKAMPDITFCDFGTRRRYSKDWQDYVVSSLRDELPRAQFLGTSNTFLAIKYGLLPMGTSAHEMDMGYSGIFHGSDEEIRASHQRVLQDWWDEYGESSSIALTDTYGTDFFFSDFSPLQAVKWKGLRQDSGDPFAFGEKAIAFYQSHNIDPRQKLLVFSDGLDIDTITKLAYRFRDRIRVTFGWGTNLTNDLGPSALSLIIKLMESNGHGTVKLSDNLAKALGKPEDVERFKKIFGYTNNEYKEVRY